MTAVQHCHSSAMSRSAQPGCGLNAHSGRRCTPASRPSRSYSPAFSQLPPQSNPSQYCVMVYCTSSTAFSRSAPCGTSLTNMSRTWVPSIAKGFAVEIGDDFHARFFHTVDDLLIFGDQFTLIATRFLRDGISACWNSGVKPSNFALLITTRSGE